MQGTRNIRIASLFLVIVLSMSLWGCGKPIDITLKFTPGQTFSVLTDQTGTQHMEVMGQKVDMPNTTKSTMDLQIVDVDPQGNANVKATYQSLIIDNGMSAMPGAPAGMADVGPKLGAALKGQSFTYKLSPAGVVSDIQGFAEMQTAALKTIEVSEEMRKVFEQTLTKMCAPENLQMTIAGLFQYLPGKPVKVGESWTTQSKLNAMLPVSTESTWTLKEQRPDAFILDRAMKITSQSSGNGEGSPLGGKIDLSGTGTGTVELDPTTGWIKSSKTTTDMAGTMAMGGGKAPQGMNMSINMSIKNENTTLITQKN